MPNATASQVMGSPKMHTSDNCGNSTNTNGNPMPISVIGINTSTASPNWAPKSEDK